jgi:gamma-glutamylcyclotransferase (GGCT)/AIG2-like uncharacterized protein YtfP
LSRVKPVPGVRHRYALAVNSFDIKQTIAASARAEQVEPEANTTLLLFVYGSLIDPIHRAEVLGHFADGVPVILYGYARARSGHWYIQRCEGAQTAGLVLTDLEAQDFATLDRYEEVPSLYTREQIEVVDMGGALIRCWVYLPTAWAAPFAE